MWNFPTDLAGAIKAVWPGRIGNSTLAEFECTKARSACHKCGRITNSIKSKKRSNTSEPLEGRAANGCESSRFEWLKRGYRGSHSSQWLILWLNIVREEGMPSNDVCCWSLFSREIRRRIIWNDIYFCRIEFINNNEYLLGISNEIESGELSHPVRPLTPETKALVGFCSKRSTISNPRERKILDIVSDGTARDICRGKTTICVTFDHKRSSFPNLFIYKNRFDKRGGRSSLQVFDVVVLSLYRTLQCLTSSNAAVDDSWW